MRQMGLSRCAWMFFVFTFGLITSLGIINSEAVAREDLIEGSRYTSAQNAALGDSSFSLGSDMASGLFYNPANLAKIRKFNFEGLNYSVIGNGGLVNNFGTNSINIISLNSFASVLNSHPDQRFGAGWSIFPSISLPFLTFGVLVQSEFSGMSNSNGTITYQTMSQLIPTVGKGFRLLNGLVRFGYSLQYVNEAVGTRTVSASSSLNYTAGLAQGSAFSHNFGLSLVAPLPSVPTLSIVVRNAFNTTYSGNSLFRFSQSPNGVPSTELMTVDAAFAFNTRLAPGLVTHWSFAYRDIQDRSDCRVTMAHVGAGAEIAVKESLFIRFGLRTGYPSAGFGIKKPGTELSLAWYTEEVGTHYQDQGDTKFMLQFRTALY